MTTFFYIMGKLIDIYLRNPFKTYKKIRKVFVSLKLKFSFGKLERIPLIFIGCPANILDIKGFDVLWKDKYDTPRYEEFPHFRIILFKKYYFMIYLTCENNSDYWEQALWYLYYYNTISYGCNEPNIEKAKESWPWQNYETKESTWTDEFLIKKI